MLRRTRAAGQPTAVVVEAQITRLDGTVEDLGVIAYAHRSRWRTMLGQRQVRGSSPLRFLLGRHPKITDTQEA